MRRLAAAFVMLLTLPCAASAQRASFEELQTFSAVLNLIRLNHVDSVTYGPMVRAAIAGALAAVDPHSRYVRAETAAELGAIERGEIPASGLRLESLAGIVTVTAVGRDGPGERAGFLAGDRIVAVRDTPVAGLGADDVDVLLARGPREFGVLVERGLHAAPQKVSLSLRTERYVWPVITAEMMVSGDVGFVRLAMFDTRSADELKSAVERLRRLGARRLVLDLRQNPGGLVTEAVDVASLFLPRNTEVFRTVGRKQDANSVHRTRSNPPFGDMPLLLMIDGATASAAEAVAASLRDHQRALVVGHRSFGKALVQGPFPLPAGDVLWLTIARVVAPSGEMIQRPYDGLSAGQYGEMAEALLRGGESIGASTTGGVAPHVYLDERPEVPAWYGVATGRGLVRPVIDAVAAGTALDPATPAQWDLLLLQPLMDSASAAGVPVVSATPSQRAVLARSLAVQATASSAGAAAASVFFVRTDPEVARALAEFDRVSPAAGR